MAPIVKAVMSCDLKKIIEICFIYSVFNCDSKINVELTSTCHIIDHEF
jgi:hypothetical protein